MCLRQGFYFGVLVAAVTLSCGSSPGTEFSARGTEADQSALSEGSSSFTLFESGQVRPLALSPNGRLLFATNTPDNRLEVFELRTGAPTHIGSIPVGLEPVAVAARTNNEVWVVNHLSDSVSIVKLTAGGRRGVVERTLLVGDEPRDIVFAGRNNSRAFITTAHRGQNVPYDPQLTTPGIGRADVWVFDAKRPGDNLTGEPITILTLFTDTPRALAVSPDGKHVYAAGFHTGNQTTAISALFNIFGGMQPPFTNFEGIEAPLVGSVLKFIDGHWVDSMGNIRDEAVNFNLPDQDVFVIDANANPPQQLAGSDGFYTGVGTVLFNMAVNPVTGAVYVSNLESRNHVRFEGPGIFGGSTIRGHSVESRITVLQQGQVLPRHLNKHVDRTTCCKPLPNDENARALAFPQSMAVSKDGTTLYVAALGSDKVGIFDTNALEADTFVPDTSDHVALTGGGPTGLILDERRGQVYVLTRYDNSISVIDTASRAEVAHVAMYNPEPPSVTEGRRFLYDAALTSSTGDQACAGCHPFADTDSLAWDLGNPDDVVIPNLNPTMGPMPLPMIFHPLKGPMTTQSLRGMANNGPMHWRGDRSGAANAPNIEPDSGAFDEHAAFMAFRPAFQHQVGRHEPITEEQMEAFTNFILQIKYPPNPIRNLDNSLTPEQQSGWEHFVGPKSFGEFTCIDCHVINRDLGQFGTNGFTTFSDQPDLTKIPHLRNLYQKVGMFGMPEVPFGLINPIDNGHKGDQIRGFGFNHDGTFDTIFRFNNVTSFTQRPDNPEGFDVDEEGMQARRDMEAFMLAFDSDFAPIMGQQVTIHHRSKSDSTSRLELMMSRAELGECDLVAKTVDKGQQRGYLYLGGGQFKQDRAGTQNLTDSDLLQIARRSPVTFTCAPPGSGIRVGIDRDEDGILDGDEN